MEWSEIKTRWQVHRDSVAHRWQRISERELDRIAGDRERLSQRIQEVYCVSMDEAERQIVDWENECASWDPSSADGPAPMEPGQVAAHSQGKAFGPGAERLVAKGKYPDQPAEHAAKPTTGGGAGDEPGVSEDDAVPVAAGNPELSQRLDHAGYMDDEEQREMNESTRPAAGSPSKSGGTGRGKQRRRDS